MGEKRSVANTGAAARRQQRQSTINSSSDTASTHVVAAATASVEANEEVLVEQQQQHKPRVVVTAEDVDDENAELNMDAWEARFPFAEKTLDPRAKELDRAHDLFLQGLCLVKKKARNNNDLSLAGEYIAAAYLRDERAVVLTNEAHENALDIDLLDTMLTHIASAVAAQQPESSSSSTASLSLGILFLIMALSGGHADENLQYIVVAMKCLSDMLDVPEEILKNIPTLGQLGGLTHAKVYYWRGRLYKDLMNNGKPALEDWTQAIRLDPWLVDARLERLVYWKNSNMKTHAELHAECLVFLDLVHEDYMDLDVIYALLASTIYLDARLGTFHEAMEYYQKSLQATRRRFDIYGICEEPDDILHHVCGSLQLSVQDPERIACQLRKQLDVFLSVATDDEGFEHSFDQPQQQHVEETIHDMYLHYHGNDAVGHSSNNALAAASRCAFRRESIQANWIEHNVYCNEWPLSSRYLAEI